MATITKGQIRARLKLYKREIGRLETELAALKASRDATILHAARDHGMSERAIATLVGVAAARVNQIKNGAMLDEQDTA